MSNKYLKYWKNNPKALSKEKVLAIFRLWNEGKLSKRAIAKDLGIGVGSVKRYLNEAGLG